ncbi:uncharacterized protein LOC134283177 [Saccostrea cucullata]|uniref:uncharacterized protein LOC134283177 n=1 Tax=Saccostrea cuccullata TaxID=36930 RepID=UPI002ED183D3
MNKRELQKRVHELEKELLECDLKRDVPHFVNPYFKDRKIQKFNGNNVPVDDWIDELASVFHAIHMSVAEKCDLIYSHLEGEAKDEIKFRSDIRSAPNEMLECLRKAFGDRESITVLQKNFFGCKQGENESIRKYSNTLLDLFQRIIRKDSSVFRHKERTLCEHFSENLRDAHIRREIKKIVRKSEECDFYALREEAILLSAEGVKMSHSEPEQKKTESEDSPSFNKLMSAIEQQQKQINQLTDIMKNPPTMTQNRFTDGYRKCFNCQEFGHISRNCPKRKDTGTQQENFAPLSTGVRR